MKTLTCLGIVILVICVHSEAHAQIPRTLSYQGMLTDAAGTLCSDGAYQFTFRLYDVASDGSSIWTEQRSLQVTNGLFSTVLGEVAGLVVVTQQHAFV